MINNLLKIGALIVTGKFLKPRIKGLIALIVFWFIISFLHDEYISYVELSGNSDYLLHFTALKIALYLIAFLLYLVVVERKLLIAEKFKKGLKNASKQKTDQLQNVGNATETDQSNDGFDFLREKKKLENPAEKLLK